MVFVTKIGNKKYTRLIVKTRSVKVTFKGGKGFLNKPKEYENKHLTVLRISANWPFSNCCLSKDVGWLK